MARIWIIEKCARFVFISFISNYGNLMICVDHDGVIHSLTPLFMSYAVRYNQHTKHNLNSTPCWRLRVCVLNVLYTFSHFCFEVSSFHSTHDIWLLAMLKKHKVMYRSHSSNIYPRVSLGGVCFIEMFSVMSNCRYMCAECRKELMPTFLSTLSFSLYIYRPRLHAAQFYDLCYNVILIVVYLHFACVYALGDIRCGNNWDFFKTAQLWNNLFN